MATVTTVDGKGGLQKLVLKPANGPASAELYLHGAHVTQWIDAKGASRLFLSDTAIFNGVKAIRGGIPVCFPQFGVFGPLSQHGFARSSAWTLAATSTASADAPSATLQLQSSDVTRAIWPHDFRTEMTVTITTAGSLAMSWTVTNTGREQFTFTSALHAYFNVDEAASAPVHGLDGIRYWDQLQNRAEVAQEGPVRFAGEVDRVYLGTPDVLDIAGGTKLLKTGLPEAVVWNPHIEKSRGMKDLGDEDWRKFVCVEPACVQTPITLAPGQVWTANLVLM